MRKIHVFSMVSLDGVLQSPGAPKEDTSGGFKLGGWVAPYGDAKYDAAVRKEITLKADYLLGRRTFEIWENYWPAHANIWPGINTGTKYVLSKTRTRSRWSPSVFFKNVAYIKRLKKQRGPDLHVWGSSELIQLLLKNDLVDELHLKIHPLTLGKGKKLFQYGAMPAAFKLTSSSSTTTGVLLASYQRAGKIKTGTAGARRTRRKAPSA